MGGAISLEYSELYPFDLNHLVLITTAIQYVWVLKVNSLN